MNIDWAALGQVFGVSLVVTVGLVGVFTLGIVGTSRKSSSGAGAEGTVATEGGAVSTGAPAVPLARAGAYVCFALCAAAVAYGIHLIAG